MIVPFFMCVGLWIGIEGYIRYQARLAGAMAVMGMGFGSFLVLQYFWMQRIFEKISFYEDPDHLLQQKRLQGALGVLLGLAVMGALIYLVAFFRVQGVWKWLYG